MKRLILLFLLFFVFNFSFSQNEKYSKVKIYTNHGELKKLMQLGIPVEDGFYNKDAFLIIDLSEREILKINNAGFQSEILIDDVIKYYKQRANTHTNIEKEKSGGCAYPQIYQTPSHFSLGTMGGFYTYQQILNELDSMAKHFPNLVSIKKPIDTLKTAEGRILYYVKISSNPNVNLNQPQVLYTALTHAREGGGMQSLFFYMYYLLENYSKNSDIKNLIDNTEMFFIPCVNPDGYCYNESTDPTGFGMWRKNRRDNGDGTMGVDINRNYGYYWGYDDTGSSPNGVDDTYRGTAGFSEPETQSIRDFCDTHHFITAINHHTYGNDLIFPYGYDEKVYTPDSTFYNEFAENLTSDNYYIHGTTYQALGYIANGGSDDWMYGEQVEKNKIFAFTPESGTQNDGFWPQTYRIPEICSGNVVMNLMTAKFAGKYATVKDLSPLYISNKQDYIKFEIERLGLTSAPSFTVSVTPITSNIISTGNASVFSAMNVLEKRRDSIPFTLDPSIKNGDQIKFLVSVDNGVYVHSDTITKRFGPSTVIFYDDCSTMNNWNSAYWGYTSEDYYSAPHSITDSPYQLYIPGQLITIDSKVPVDLTNALAANLTFKSKWSIEADLSYAQIEVYKSKYTRPGTSDQAYVEPVYDGTVYKWVDESVSLDDFVGQKIYIEFSLMTSSNNNYKYDGFYFDDVSITKLNGTNSVADIEEQNFYLSEPMPNPATNESVITFKSPVLINNAVFEITDMTGKIVFIKDINSTNGSIKLNTLNLNKGVYLYSIHSDSFRSKVKKIIITEN